MYQKLARDLKSGDIVRAADSFQIYDWTIIRAVSKDNKTDWVNITIDTGDGELVMNINPEQEFIVKDEND